jgi:hypothetical protein
MGMNGGAPFFNAPDPERDGTLAEPIRGETFADPLSGLVTAAEPPPATAADEAGRLPTARPVKHDPEVVKRMVEEALREDVQPGPRTPEAVQPAGIRPDGVPLGLLPRQRTWPTRAPELLKKVPRPRPKPRPDIADDDIEAELAERQVGKRGLPTIGMPSFGRPSTNAAGVVIAVLLLVVFGVVAITMVSSLVSSVVGLFD